MSAPVTGQVALSNVPQRLSPTPQNVTAWVLKAPAGNAATAWIGNATVASSTGHAVDPSESFKYELADENGLPTFQLGPYDVWAVGTSGDILTWFASP